MRDGGRGAVIGAALGAGGYQAGEFGLRQRRGVGGEGGRGREVREGIFPAVVGPVGAGGEVGVARSDGRGGVRGVGCDLRF